MNKGHKWLQWWGHIFHNTCAAIQLPREKIWPGVTILTEICQRDRNKQTFDMKEYEP